MRGRIIRYSFQTNTGAISGDDGVRYSFHNQDWKEETPPATNMYVDFDVRVDPSTQAHTALEIFSVATSGRKDKFAAGILALFLGSIGIHKFYLGFTGVGVLYVILAISMVGLLYTVPASIIEGIIYISKTNEDFDRIYVQGRRAWF